MNTKNNQIDTEMGMTALEHCQEDYSWEYEQFCKHKNLPQNEETADQFLHVLEFELLENPEEYPYILIEIDDIESYLEYQI